MNAVQPVNTMQPPPRRSALAGFLRVVTLLVLVFALLFAGYYLYFNVLNLAPANVYTVHRSTAVSAVYGTVTISASAADTLLAQNSGFLEMKLKGTPVTLNGQTVTQGQLIAEVVDEATERGLIQAKKDLDVALTHQKAGPTVTTALQAAKETVAAYDKLAKGAVPTVTVNAAKGEVLRLQTAFDYETVEFQRAVDLATTALKTAEEQVKRARVESPLDGVLTAVNFNDNSYVQINQALFTVSTNTMYVSGEVNEEDVGALQKDMKAELHLYAYPTTTFAATVTGVFPDPDPNSSRYTVLLNMDDPPDNLRYGLTGEMNIILGRKPNSITIPTRALNTDQVLIVQRGVVAQRTVKVGFKSLEFAEILDGINEGDQVIVSDQDAFRAGERVRPVPVNVVREADK